MHFYRWLHFALCLLLLVFAGFGCDVKEKRELHTAHHTISYILICTVRRLLLVYVSIWRLIQQPHASFDFFAYATRSSFSRQSEKIMIEVIERGWILLVPLFIQCTHKHCQPIIRTNTQIHRPMPQIGSVHGNRCKSCIMSVIWFINPTAILPRYNSGCVYCLRILSTKLNPILVLSTNQNALINCCIEKCNAMHLQMKSTHTNTHKYKLRFIPFGPLANGKDEF